MHLTCVSEGGLQHRYTRTGGARPYGVSCLVAGFDGDSRRPTIFRSEPSGAFAEWTASAVGKASEKVTVQVFSMYRDIVKVKEKVMEGIDWESGKFVMTATTRIFIGADDSPGILQVFIQVLFLLSCRVMSHSPDFRLRERPRRVSCHNLRDVIGLRLKFFLSRVLDRHVLRLYFRNFDNFGQIAFGVAPSSVSRLHSTTVHRVPFTRSCRHWPSSNPCPI